MSCKSACEKRGDATQGRRLLRVRAWAGGCNRPIGTSLPFRKDGMNRIIVAGFATVADDAQMATQQSCARRLCQSLSEDLAFSFACSASGHVSPVAG